MANESARPSAACIHLVPSACRDDLRITISTGIMVEWMGTRDQLNAEGFIPHWVDWQSSVLWRSDGFIYVLHQPALCEPNQWRVFRNRDMAVGEIEQRRIDLADAIWRNSPRAQFEAEILTRLHAGARADDTFQALMAICLSSGSGRAA